MNRSLQVIQELKLTLKTHDSLNPKLWKDEKLIPEVWIALNRFAKTWAEFANIPRKAIRDIVIIGSNANYNYTKFSDVDVHLLIDKDKISCEGLVDDYLQGKKELWSLTHDVKIKGHHVEPYAQDYRDVFKAGQGVYSITSNKWIQRPTKVKVNHNSSEVKSKVKEIMKQIDTLIDSKSDNYEAFSKLKNRIKRMRVAGIQKGGEFSSENLAFKELRNQQYLKKMNDYMRLIHDKSLSL